MCGGGVNGDGSLQVVPYPSTVRPALAVRSSANASEPTAGPLPWPRTRGPRRGRAVTIRPSHPRRAAPAVLYKATGQQATDGPGREARRPHRHGRALDGDATSTPSARRKNNREVSIR